MTKRLMVGDVAVGGGAPVSIQSMCNTKTDDVRATVEQIHALEAAGCEITFQCRNNLGAALSGLLEVGGKTYPVLDGTVTVELAPGQYRWRIRSDGYGAHTDTLTVTEEAQSLTLDFENNETLIAAAAETLSITYQEGDSAEAATGTLGLPVLLDHGVTVSWSSSAPNVITDDGHVFLPEEAGTDVVLTATISRGDAEPAVTTFTVHVPSKAEVTPAAPTVPTKPDDADTEDAADTADTVDTAPAEAEKPASGSNSGETAEPEKTLPNFTDLAKYDWAKDAIYQLAEAGVIQGTSDTTYTPAANIRRADFILLLDRLLGLESDKTAEAFTDVPKDSYYYEAVHTARALGIAQGDGGKFRPEDSITRQDMITLTMRAIEAASYLPDTDVHASLTRFLDSGDVADYARDSMEAAVGQEFIIGDQNLLDPLGYTTRAQAAVFVARIMNAHIG